MSVDEEKVVAGVLAEIEVRMLTHDEAARLAGVSSLNLSALLEGYWNPHIAAALCKAFAVDATGTSAAEFTAAVNPVETDWQR